MPFRFRRSIRLLPGLSINFGKRSVSMRVGVRGLGLTVGTKGARVSAGIPGTGIGWTETLGSPEERE